MTTKVLAPSHTPRPKGFDYNTAGGQITVTSAPRPARFTWGKVLRVHVVGDDYAIVEYTPNQAGNVSNEDYDPSPRFSLFVRGCSHHKHGWDTGHSYRSLDRALIAAVAWRAAYTVHGWSAAANSDAVEHIARMLQLDSPFWR